MEDKPNLTKSNGPIGPGPIGKEGDIEQSVSESELTRAERKRLQRQAAKEERREQKKNNDKKASNSKIVILTVGLLIAAAIGFFIYSGIAKASSMNEFSNCLNEKGAIIYGNNWCQYTQKQMNLFGKSFSNLKYVVCDENKALCDQKQISITPTWEIEGKMYREVQTIEQLSALSGCRMGG